MRRVRMKMPKKAIYIRTIPSAISFSDLEQQYKDAGFSFDPIDDNQDIINTENKMDYENLIYNILNVLNERDKILFLFLLIRNYGVSIDHKTFAETLKISRTYYLYLLKKVKIKIKLLIDKYDVSLKKRKESRLKSDI